MQLIDASRKKYDAGLRRTSGNRDRYYDPSTGRYVTSDPIGLDGGVNTYVYVAGNPLRYSDRFGLLDPNKPVPFKPIVRPPTVPTKPGLLPVLNPIGVLIGGLLFPSPLADGTLPQDAPSGFLDGNDDGDDGQNPGDGSCEDACYDAADRARKSCQQLYGKSGIFPGSNSGLVSCLLGVKEALQDCIDQCRCQ